MGVLLLGWSVFGVVLYYWMEAAVAAVMLIPRISALEHRRRAGRGGATVGLAGPKARDDVVQVLVFSVLPVLGLGFLVVAIFGRGAAPGVVDVDIAMSGLLVGLAAIVLAQVVDIGVDLRRGPGALRASIDAQTTAVFDRYVTMLLTVIVAGYFIERLGGPVAGLCVLIAFKTTADLLQPES